MDAPVVFDRVWKKFRRGERHDSLRDLIPALARSLVSRRRTDELDQREFWALEDVSFEVPAGQALGIIGPNGAGKSTVLKLLTRILRPTRGRCLVTGRMGALIEIAAGFHPDLTGRENIFLQGAIMGMKRAEIARRLDEIVDFAGVADFIDTPVKRYSSGMNARLGFSIAAHLDPDVLIIDEVLSVGDSAFQDRCVRRMEEFKRQGVTIVFVSHNLPAVSALCDQAILLQREIRTSGLTDTVLRAYVELQATASAPPVATPVHLESARLAAGPATRSGALRPGESIRLDVDVALDEPVSDLTFGLRVFRSTDRLLVYEAQLSQSDLDLAPVEPAGRFTLSFGFQVNLVQGEYFAECWVLHSPTHRFLSVLSPAAILSVTEARRHRGIANINLDVRVVGRDTVLVGSGVKR
jgi:lipopolysaccharide transport system ATP-binding protein